MIKLENYEITGWEAAIRGMRNPMNSWNKGDSSFKEVAEIDILDYNPPAKQPVPKKQLVYYDALSIGPNDHSLMTKLANAGSVHGKFRRMITVYIDITAPLYWWKEFDTYKVGTVANSCSTMHKIHEKEFTYDDFSIEHVGDVPNCDPMYGGAFDHIIMVLNEARHCYLETKDKAYWWQMIQLLPTSYNQKRTVMLNYEVLANIYEYRKDHKLDEWVDFCKWIETLPYSEIITGGKSDV